MPAGILIDLYCLRPDELQVMDFALRLFSSLAKGDMCWLKNLLLENVKPLREKMTAKEKKKIDF